MTMVMVVVDKKIIIQLGGSENENIVLIEQEQERIINLFSSEGLLH